MARGVNPTRGSLAIQYTLFDGRETILAKTF